MPDIHIGGLLSGQDVSGWIEKILAAEAAPLETLYEEKDELDADIAAWSDISISATDLTDVLDDLRSLTLWSQMEALSSDETKMTASASSSAIETTYAMIIEQLAQAHTVATDRADDLSTGATSTTDLVAAGVLNAGDEFDLEGQTITIDATESLSTLRTKINTAAESMATGSKVLATILDDRLVIMREDTGATQLDISDITGTPLMDLGFIYKPTPPSGDVLYLDMITDNSPNVLDYSGNNNHGTVGGSATFTSAGKYQGAYDLNAATSDYITVPQDPTLDSYDEFSMSVWVKTSSSGAQTLISYGDLGIDAGVLLRLNGGVPQAYIDDGTTQVAVSGSASIADGEWHQVTITDDGSTFSLFVDGQEADTQDSSGVGVITTNIHDTTEVGRQWNSGSATNYYTGTIDEVTVFNRALSETEVEDYCNSFKNELLEAQDAVFYVDGARVTRSENMEIDDVIENVTLNLYATADASDQLYLRVDNDTTDAKDTILDFVDKYNALADKLQYYRESNIEEGEIVTGELHGDSLVQSMYSNIRKWATNSKYPYLNQTNAEYTYEGRTGVMDCLEDIGIWTAGRDNILEVDDEDRLDYFLENNFDEVAQLFRGVYDATNGYEHGVATDFYNYSYSLTDAITGDIDRRITRLEEQVDDNEDETKKLSKRLDDEEQRLWEEFTAMEDAIGKMQSDLAYLAGQLGSTKS